jgi:voltage-gated potassium channel
VRDRTGALVLALRHRDGTFNTNPSPETMIQPGQVIIAIGTPRDLGSLENLVGQHAAHTTPEGGS